MRHTGDGSVNLVVTSPPYPMIEMWDSLFSAYQPAIAGAVDESRYAQVFEMMHGVLDSVWKETDRVLAPSGIVCINIGDATRTVNGRFRLFPNHVRVARYFHDAGYDMLPLILWRKQSNKPNKFMGSGMLPVNAYVTLEHEYILIFRKGGNRTFKDDATARRKSAFFREERNLWFSDVWSDLKGVPQSMNGKQKRERSAAYPFDIPYRLIQMYSIQGDTVLDPFLGTGTTTLAAMASGRSSVGYEADTGLRETIEARISGVISLADKVNCERLERHRKAMSGPGIGKIRYQAGEYDFDVATKQETEIELPVIESLNKTSDMTYEVTFADSIKR